VERAAFRGHPQVVGRQFVHDQERLARGRDDRGHRPLPGRHVQVEAGEHVEVVRVLHQQGLAVVLLQPPAHAAAAVHEDF